MSNDFEVHDRGTSDELYHLRKLARAVDEMVSIPEELQDAYELLMKHYDRVEHV